MFKLLLLAAFIQFNILFAPKEITWVAIGDSITYLNEHSDEAGNRITKGYMTRLVEKLPTIHYINQGHSGWASGGIAGEIEKLGIVKADVYSVFLGTNDWWQGRPVGTLSDYQKNTGNATLYGAYRIIINKIRGLNNEAKIILITPMQRVDFVYMANMKNNAWGSYKDKNGQSLKQFAEAIAVIAGLEHFDLADLYNNSGMQHKNLVKFKRVKNPQTGVYKNYSYPSFIGVPFNPETDEYPYPLEAIDITYDGLHPSDKGYTIIADILVKIMEKY